MVQLYFTPHIVYVDGAAIFAPHVVYADGAVELQYSKNRSNLR